MEIGGEITPSRDRVVFVYIYNNYNIIIYTKLLYSYLSIYTVLWEKRLVFFVVVSKK